MLGGQDAVVAEQGLLDGAQPEPGAAAEIRDGESATRAGAKASLPVDEPRRAGARDQDGPLLAVEGAEAGTKGIGGELHPRKREGHGQHGVVAVGELGGGECEPDSHPLFALPGQTRVDAGLIDGSQHMTVGEGDAQLQIGAGGAPLAEQLACVVANAGPGVGAAAIHPDPELNHGGLPARFAR